MAKWQVLQAVHPECRQSIAEFYEDFLDRVRYEYAGLSIQDAAIAFCRWRGEEISV